MEAEIQKFIIKTTKGNIKYLQKKPEKYLISIFYFFVQSSANCPLKQKALDVLRNNDDFLEDKIVKENNKNSKTSLDFDKVSLIKAKKIRFLFELNRN